MIYNTGEELRDKVCEKVYEVYEVFRNFFGEEYTDLQNLPSAEFCLPEGVAMDSLASTDITDSWISSLRSEFRSYPFIIVYWPVVTVTNENDKSVVIHELYAKIDITLEGRIPYECKGFTLNRSRYSMLQFMSGYSHRGYMHSHISQIPKDNFSIFQSPCLGTGPINGTIATLKNNCDEITWMLFCQELSMYVTVESLSGIPYNKLEEIGNSQLMSAYSGYLGGIHRCFFSLRAFERIFHDDDFKAFIKYYLENGHLSLCYKEGKYDVGMSFFDFIIDISNAFIAFFNRYCPGIRTEELFEEEILYRTIVQDGKFYENAATSSREDVSRYIGRHVLWFKGRDIRLTIDENTESEPVVTIILNKDIAMIILSNILTVINYRYKNEHNSKNGRTETTTAYQNVTYL